MQGGLSMSSSSTRTILIRAIAVLSASVLVGGCSDNPKPRKLDTGVVPEVDSGTPTPTPDAARPADTAVTPDAARVDVAAGDTAAGDGGASDVAVTDALVDVAGSDLGA